MMEVRESSLPPHVRRHRLSGKYRAVISVGRRRRSYGPLRESIEAAAADAEQMLEERRRALEEQATLQLGFEALLLDLRETGARSATVDYYRKQWRCLTGPDGWSPEWPLEEITTEQVHAFAEARQQRGNTARTVWAQNVQALRRITRLAARRGLVAVDPLQHLTVPRSRGGRFAVLSAAKVAEVVEAIRSSEQGTRAGRERDALLVELLFRTGLRRSELARLRPCDIDQVGRTMHVDGKTGNRRLPLTNRVADILDRLGRDRPLDAPLVGDAEMIGNRLALWRSRLDEPHLSAHVLRHSFATAMVERGVGQLVLAELLGHSDVRQTARYYHGTTAVHRAALSSLDDVDTEHPFFSAMRRGTRHVSS